MSKARVTGAIHHLWRGEAFAEREIDAHLDALGADLIRIAGTRLPREIVIGACDRLARELTADGPFVHELRESLRAVGTITSGEIDDGIRGIAEFLRAENLERKVRRELDGGALESRDPLDPRRIDPRESIFEAWAPLGFLVHVASANAFSVGVLSMIEGFLVSNVGFLKLSRADGDFPLLFLRRLGELDPSGRLREFIYAARIGSDESARLAKVFREADGVAAWGGEDGIEGVRKLTPSHARFVDWGPKISFAYISRAVLSEPTALTEGLRAIAREACLLEQQACSSPQVVYFEVDPEDRALDSLAERLFRIFGEESRKTSRIEPGEMESAEITTVLELARLEACLGATEVYADEHVRVVLERKCGLRASPLFRTLWVKPLPRARLVETLRPLRAYLQTAGLLCAREEYGELSESLARAGVLRVTEPGKMLESYLGEPHDGVYALARYARRLSFQAGAQAGTLSRLGELTDRLGTSISETSKATPILTKAGFQSLPFPEGGADLYFKSGGSSGKAKISVFTYEDYHTQMEFASEGLRAAGLDPARDRCMNLFFGGGLYGGFLSFFTILEKLRVVQFPMAAHSDLAFIREIIVEHGVNTLLGMPSSIIQLFNEEGAALAAYGGVKKIFYGGEHFHDLQRKHFRENFGVATIRSASYGSVDAGPLGFQCEHCPGSVHHLHTGLHDVEVVEFERDVAVARGAPGRLLVSVKHRRGQAIRRYEIGDTVREILTPCPCGRVQPRYELLGRHGDVFRVGGVFLNYQRFERTLQERFDYAHEFQIRLPKAAGADREGIVVCFVDSVRIDPAALREGLLDADSDLAEAVRKDRALEIETRAVPLDTFRRTAGSGKLIRIVDERGEEA